MTERDTKPVGDDGTDTEITLHRCICGATRESRLDFYDHISGEHDAFWLVTQAYLDSVAEVPDVEAFDE